MRWRVIGEQHLTVPAGAFNVWIIEHIEEGMLGNVFRGERMYYIDKASGSAVKVRSRVVRGSANWANWEAHSLTRAR